MPSGPPDKLQSYPLSAYTTVAERLSAINNYIAEFNTTYGVYPGFIILDSIVNALYLGTYD
jgi:hypothetical protein